MKLCLNIIHYLIGNSDRTGDGERESDDEESASGDESSDLWTLLKYIMNYRTNLGLRLAEPFIRLPSKRLVISAHERDVPGERSFQTLTMILYCRRIQCCGMVYCVSCIIVLYATLTRQTYFQLEQGINITLCGLLTPEMHYFEIFFMACAYVRPAGILIIFFG